MATRRFYRPELKQQSVRIELPPRKSQIYWRVLEYCRLIGLHKKSHHELYWVARYRVEKTQAYRQHRLGETDTHCSADGDQYLSYDQAVEKAWEWFENPNVKSHARPHYPIGNNRSLKFSPIGDEYSIGHALRDFVKWKELASAESYFLTLISHCNYHIAPRLAHLKADDVNQDHIQSFVQEILETPPKKGNRPLGPRRPIASYGEEERRKRRKTANTSLGILRSSLEMAWENDKIKSDKVFRRIKKLRNVDHPRTLHLSREECRSLLGACQTSMRNLILGALYTGCRRSELVTMRAGQVGREGYGISVPPVKTTRSRFVFLPDEGMSFFLEMARGKHSDQLLFVQDTGTSWKYNFRYKFDKAKDAAGVPKDFTFHGLRHTYASQLIQSGAPLIVVADQLGHANVMQVVRTYGHLSPMIRESEVRQRFTSISNKYSRLSKARRESLKKWRESLYGGNWRTYATILDLESRRNTEYQ